jgi:arginine deiminase
MNINISSETDHLNAVIVHTPGREVSLVNPNLKEELLFDDIIFESDARREHLDMLRVFETAMPKKGRIFEITDLAVECFREEDLRAEFIGMMIDELPHENIHTIEKELILLDGEAFVRFLADGTAGGPFSLHPAPNMLFTRDLAAVVGENIILSRAARKARVREFLMMSMIVSHHPLFEKVSKNIIRVGGRQSIEGGDVLVAAPNIVLIGMSERTSFSGLMSVAERLLAREIDHVLAVDIPKQRSSMHLDTIFTFTDETECVVFPPAITGQTHNVVHLFSDGDVVKARQCHSLKETLEELTGREFTFIHCGGRERINQYREQWTDGANLFALAPGVVVGYGRNTQTFEAMKEYGYRHMTQFEFIEEFKGKPFDPAARQKTAISFEGNELCRGRGGARCMTLPILRTAVNYST